jgi:hypothetical protein
MKVRALITAVLAAGALTLTTALPAQAADSYTDPLTRGDLITYNNHTYALSIKANTTKTVTRYDHKVPATYRARIIQSTNNGDKVLYSASLGYYRTAYLRTKLAAYDTQRSYGVATYAKKIASFSADYAKARVNLFVKNYLEKTLRGDVRVTVSDIEAYKADHGSLVGIEKEPNIVVISDGFFGYGDGDNVKMTITIDPRYNNQEYVVTAIDRVDLYQSVYDSYTTTIRSGHVSSVIGLT